MDTMQCYNPEKIGTILYGRQFGLKHKQKQKELLFAGEKVANKGNIRVICKKNLENTFFFKEIM